MCVFATSIANSLSKNSKMSENKHNWCLQMSNEKIDNSDEILKSIYCICYIIDTTKTEI